jgi:hypothetical protein
MPRSASSIETKPWTRHSKNGHSYENRRSTSSCRSASAETGVNSISASMVLNLKIATVREGEKEGALLILPLGSGAPRQALRLLPFHRQDNNQEHHLRMDNAIAVRCPCCGHIPIRLPPTHKCPECEVFSHEWLIYDWESFANFRIQHLKYNILIISMVFINLIALVTFECSNIVLWVVNILSIPATISLFRCFKDLRGKSKYQGHSGLALIPWFTGFT